MKKQARQNKKFMKFNKNHCLSNKYILRQVPSAGCLDRPLYDNSSITKPILSLSALNLLDQKILLNNSNMKFGNYVYKQYGLVVPRMKSELSLYEKLYLREHVNDETVKRVFSSTGNYDKSQDQENIKRTIRSPSMIHHLYSNKNTITQNLERPVLFDSSRKFENNSEKRRYKNICTEFHMLRTKLMFEPENSKFICCAVYFFY